MRRARLALQRMTPFTITPPKPRMRRAFKLWYREKRNDVLIQMGV